MGAGEPRQARSGGRWPRHGGRAIGRVIGWVLGMALQASVCAAAGVVQAAEPEPAHAHAADLPPVARPTPADTGSAWHRWALRALALGVGAGLGAALLRLGQGGGPGRPRRPDADVETGAETGVDRRGR